MRHRNQIAIALIVFFFAAGCTPSQKEFNEDDVVTVRVTFREALSWAPFIIGVENGHFADQGIEIEYLPTMRTGEAIAAMQGGQLDVHAGATNVALFNALSQGENLAIVGSRGVNDPEAECSYSGFIAPQALIDGDFADLANLAGVKTSFSTGGFQQFTLDKALEGSGISTDDIEEIDIPNAAESEALADGSILMAYATEPWATRLLDAGPNAFLLRDDQVWPGADWGLLIFGHTLLGENQAIGERFMVGYLNAVADYLEGKTEANVAMLAEATQLEPDLIQQACWPAFKNDGSVNTAHIMEFQEWAQGRDFLDDIVPEDQVYNDHFVEFARDN